MNLFTKLNVTVRETKRIVEIFSNTVKKTLEWMYVSIVVLC